jgi:hypothetical protein
VGALREMLIKGATPSPDAPVRRATGPVPASNAAYPSTRPTIAVRTVDVPGAGSGENSNDR